MKKLFVVVFLLIATLSFANPFVGTWRVYQVVYNYTSDQWEEVATDIIVKFNEDLTLESWSTEGTPTRQVGTYSFYENVLLYKYDEEEIVNPTNGIRMFELGEDDKTIVVKNVFFLTMGGTTQTILEVLENAGIKQTLPQLYMFIWQIYDNATDSDTQVLKRIEIKSSI